MEAGNCHEVERRVAAIREVAIAAGQAIRVTGIVDRDFKPEAEVARLSALGLHVLPCHEIENLFLCPSTLSDLAGKLGQKLDVIATIVAAGDEMAGRWVFQKACSSGEFRDLDLNSAKKVAGAANWLTVSNSGGASFVKAMQGALGKAPAGRQIAFDTALASNIKDYDNARANADFWILCMGKEVLPRVSKLMSLASAEALERAVVTAWRQNPELQPVQYRQVAKVLESL